MRQSAADLTLSVGYAHLFPPIRLPSLAASPPPRSLRSSNGAPHALAASPGADAKPRSGCRLQCSRRAIHGEALASRAQGKTAVQWARRPRGVLHLNTPTTSVPAAGRGKFMARGRGGHPKRHVALRRHVGDEEAFGTPIFLVTNLRL